MPDDPYTLTDLARLADVTPRTVRYYVHRGLLPSPEAAGPATRYGDGHLLRLRLIRLLQREHLPLAEIRTRLERMNDGEVETALRGAPATSPEPPLSTDATLAYVRSLMTRAGVAPRLYRTPEPPPRGAFRTDVPDGFPIRDAPGVEVPDASPDASPDGSPDGSPLPGRIDAPRQPSEFPARPHVIVPLRPMGAPSAPPATAPRHGTERSTWERTSITGDVEIHVRRPLDRQRNKRVEQLIRIARELFDADA
jgi:DNA-binding transcriptional MerR regulator